MIVGGGTCMVVGGMWGVCVWLPGGACMVSQGCVWLSGGVWLWWACMVVGGMCGCRGSITLLWGGGTHNVVVGGQCNLVAWGHAWHMTRYS